MNSLASAHGSTTVGRFAMSLRRIAAPRITTGALWLVLPVAFTFSLVGASTDFPLDYWHHVCAGRQMVETGTVWQVDSFTHTCAGREVVNQNWLVQIAAYRLHQWGGYPAVQFAASLGYASAIALCAALVYWRSQDARAAGILAIAVFFVGASNFGVRPQAISMTLFVAELFALWRWPGRRRLIAIVAAVELVWTNVHGAFPLGVALPGMFMTAAAWERWRADGWRSIFHDRSIRIYAICVAVAMVAMFCNPFPKQTAQYVFGVVSHSSARQIGEWLPTSFGTTAGKAYFLSVVAVVGLLGLSRKRLEPVELLLLVSFLVLGATAQRMVVWWGFAAAAAVARLLTADRVAGEKTRESRSVVNTAILALVVLWAVGSTPWTRAANPLLPSYKRTPSVVGEPSGAMEFMRRERIGGKLFNTMSWGSYLSWHLPGKVQTFVDGRMELVADDVWNDFVAVGTLAPGWQDRLDRYGVDAVVWNQGVSPALAAALEELPLWRRVYSDSLAVVFVRNVPSPAAEAI